jgi:branched-chain amino acid transport system substrate-binding protein
MGVIYETAKRLKGDVSDKARVMATIKGLVMPSPRGSFTIDPETRGVVQTVYIAKVEKRNGVLVPVVIDRFDGARD